MNRCVFPLFFVNKYLRIERIEVAILKSGHMTQEFSLRSFCIVPSYLPLEQILIGNIFLIEKN